MKTKLETHTNKLWIDYPQSEDVLEENKFWKRYEQAIKSSRESSNYPTPQQPHWFEQFRQPFLSQQSIEVGYQSTSQPTQQPIPFIDYASLYQALPNKMYKTYNRIDDQAIAGLVMIFVASLIFSVIISLKSDGFSWMFFMASFLITGTILASIYSKQAFRPNLQATHLYLLEVAKDHLVYTSEQKGRRKIPFNRIVKVKKTDSQIKIKTDFQTRSSKKYKLPLYDVDMKELPNYPFIDLMSFLETIARDNRRRKKMV